MQTMQPQNTLDSFRLDGRVIVITGGAGFLGRKHAQAVLDAGGIAVLLDISSQNLANALDSLDPKNTFGFKCDITLESEVGRMAEDILKRFGRIDGLINNAATNPKIEDEDNRNFSRLEHFPLHIWQKDLSIGLTGAMLCSRIFASAMKQAGRGAILNIASDLALIGPDQRIYRQEGLSEDEQPVKPVTYSVVKAGLLGLTRYCATYYAKDNIRCNALAPGGVYAGQNEDFTAKLTNLIPMGRMAFEDELKGAVLFLLSDASQYITGTCLSVDGGRTCW